MPDDDLPGVSEPLERRRQVPTFRGFNRNIVGKVVTGREMDPTSVEQYRRLAATLHHEQSERGINKVMVASAVPGEGKTLTALNLALTLSESYRRRVVLVDADLRRPRVHDMLNIPNGTGLNETLTQRGQSRATLVHVSPRLSVLPAGRPNSDPMGALSSQRMARLLEKAAANFDWVVVDTPPVVQLADANLLAAMVDVAVLVIEAGRTSYDLSDRAITALGRERILGIVLNGVVEADESDYAYSGYSIED
jgi:capsular exopolysaccharide synthesis family protein